MKERLDDQSTETEGRRRIARERQLASKPIIEEQARRQVRTFLDELRNDTSEYRAVANLGDEVAKEYQGRAVMELLQNAYDVLGFAGEGVGERRRVSFVLNSSTEQPELLVANSGRPFRREDFHGICNLAQSPKPPEENVGNKGLGFRSVQALTTRPEVWSTASAGEDAAFTFGFDPDALESVSRVATRLFDGERRPTDPAFGQDPVVSWPDELIDEYQGTLSRKGESAEVRKWIADEVSDYLSPYKLPRYLGDPPDEVARLLEDGHVTVIRLRLDGGKAGNAEAAARAIKSVREQLDLLNAAAMVFLPDLSVLRISIDGKCCERTRSVDPDLPFPAPLVQRERVRVVRVGPDDADATERSFQVWSRTFGGADRSDEAELIQAAVRDFPKRWHDVQEVSVAVAVDETRTAPQGLYFISLPTETDTTVGAHINAPFYGSLDRRHIHFEHEYNKQLLEFVTKLMRDVTEGLVAGDPKPWRGRAVIDLLARIPDSPDAIPDLSEVKKKGPRLTDALRKLSFADDRPLDDSALILCDDGWRVPAAARTMPNIPADDPLGEDEWRAHAGFNVVSSALEERREAVEALLRALGGSQVPTDGEWADTLARMAEWVRDSRTEPAWDDFLRSTLAVLPRELASEPAKPDADPLRAARFLPTSDGGLCAGTDDVRVFFRPRRGDDAAGFVDSIPDSLKERIAFLHSGVKTLVVDGKRNLNTPVQKFLDGRFVRSFLREDILRAVVDLSPKLPVAHGSADARACAEILSWTLNLAGEEEREGLLPLIGRLPVPCLGGWFAMKDAVFGPGWHDRRGEHLKTLADCLSEREGDRLLRTALLPPGDSRWNGTDAYDPETGMEVAARGNLFARVGVAEGLRIENLDSPMRFWMKDSHRELPDKAPVGIPPSLWTHWRDSVRHEINLGFVRWHEYEIKVESFKLLPIRNLLQRDDLAEPARRVVAELILTSIAHWGVGWDEVSISKRKGHAWSQHITSPLKHWLSTLPWLDDRSGRDHTPRREPQPLCQRWLVPEALLRLNMGHFRHLSPLSPELARRLAEDEELLGALKGLGLNVYPTEEDDRTGPALLDALARVVQLPTRDGEKNDGVGPADGAGADDPMPAGGFDVVLGQIRHAWSHFDTVKKLPERLVVRTKPYKFEIRTAADIGDAYLPDHTAHTRSLRELHQPILAMWPKEAHGAIGDLLHEKGARRASDLQEQCLVDGRPAADLLETSQPLETRLQWLPVVLLSLAAYGGNNPRGPATGAWLKARERLQRARVLLCDSIEVKLLGADGEAVARSEPQAYWLPQDGDAAGGDPGTSGTLLLKRDVADHALYERIAPAAQAMLWRQDLLKDLRLVLGALAGDPQPAHSQVEDALGRAEIDGFDVANIRGQCGVRVLRDRIRPVLKLLRVPDDGLNDAEDVSGLTEWLKNAGIAEWPAEDLMDAARECCDDFEMGLRAFETRGVDVELPDWNRVLEDLGGDYRPVENQYAADQTDRHLMVMARSLRALARHVANRSPEGKDRAKLFSKVCAVHQAFMMDPGWRRRWWRVPFGAVLGALLDRYAGIPETDGHLGAFADAHDSTEFGHREFEEALKGQGVALDSDPHDVARGNEHRVTLAFRRMWRVYLAWLAKQGRDRKVIEPAPAIDLDATRYLREWSADEVFEQARRLIDDEGFLKHTHCCTTIDAMCKRLGISREDCDGPEPPPNGPDPVDPDVIAGEPFVFGRDSYRDLFERLDRLEIGRVVVDPPGDDPRGQYVGSSGRGGSTSGGAASRDESSRPRPRRPIVHHPPHLPELIGIVGEMHAYRYLKSAFGLHEDGWVAQFRTKVFRPGKGEEDRTDDSLGYDFEFAHPDDGRIWCVEVKSTTGDGTSFDVTSGELAAARHLAGSKEKRWLFLRVRQAFSNRPEFDWLPNPFEPAGRSLELRHGSMTVDYGRAKDRRTTEPQ